MRPILASYDSAMAHVRSVAQGFRTEIRLGYLISVIEGYLNPALAALRSAHPDVKVRLLDLYPSEQIQALRNCEIDVALIGQEGVVLAREFYTKKLATISVVAALPANHRLASRKQINLIDLRDEPFVGAPENLTPGRTRWIVQLCQNAGFRPNLVQDGENVAQLVSSIVSEGLVTVAPSYKCYFPAPGVALLPVTDPHATWDLFVVWQRGRIAAPVKTFLDALTQLVESKSPSSLRAFV